MAIELATAYISIIPETSKIAPEVRKQFKGVDKEAAKTGKSSGQALSSKITGTLSKAMKRTVAGVGLAAGGALSLSLFKGFGRLQGIEQAEAKLSGLGHSAKAVDKIMGNALKSVKGTAFGLDEAATTAAGAVAAGVKPGKELERSLTLVGDAATIAGVGMGEMGAIFNKVAASNKIQGDVIAQLNDAGIPIIQLLGKELGKSAEQVVELASKGKIDFATFQKAMESGVGGAAQKSGKTFSGALANMQAAMGRLGASALSGVFSKMPKVFGSITGALDRLGPAAESVGKAVGTGFSRAGKAVRDFLKSSAAGKIFDTIAEAAASVAEGMRELAPAVVEVFEAFKPKVLAAVKVVLGGLLLAVTGLARMFADYLAPAIAASLGWIADNSDVFLTFVGVLAAVKVGILAVALATKVWAIAQGILNAVMAVNPITLVVIAIAALAAGLVYAYKKSETFRGFVNLLWEGMKVYGAWVRDTLWPIIKKFWDGMVKFGGWLVQVFTPVFDGIVWALKSLWDILEPVRKAFVWTFKKIGEAVDPLVKKLADAWGLLEKFKGDDDWLTWNEEGKITGRSATGDYFRDRHGSGGPPMSQPGRVPDSMRPSANRAPNRREGPLIQINGGIRAHSYDDFMVQMTRRGQSAALGGLV